MAYNRSYKPLSPLDDEIIDTQSLWKAEEKAMRKEGKFNPYRRGNATM